MHGNDTLHKVTVPVSRPKIFFKGGCKSYSENGFEAEGRLFRRKTTIAPYKYLLTKKWSLTLHLQCQLHFDNRTFDNTEEKIGIIFFSISFYFFYKISKKLNYQSFSRRHEKVYWMDALSLLLKGKYCREVGGKALGKIVMKVILNISTLFTVIIVFKTNIPFPSLANISIPSSSFLFHL